MKKYTCCILLTSIFFVQCHTPFGMTRESFSGENVYLGIQINTCEEKNGCFSVNENNEYEEKVISTVKSTKKNHRDMYTDPLANSEKVIRSNYNHIAIFVLALIGGVAGFIIK